MSPSLYEILSGNPFRLIAIGLCLVLIVLLAQVRRIRIKHHARGCEIQREIYADKTKRLVKEDRKECVK